MLLSRREYAKHRGVDDKAVRNAIATGRITTIHDMIDPEVADKQWDENTRHEFAPRTHTNDDRASSIAQSNRQKKETLEIMLKKLEYDEKSGKLISREEVERDVFNAARAARELWKGVVHRVAPMLLCKTEIAEIEQILDPEIGPFLEVLTSCLRGNNT